MEPVQQYPNAFGHPETALAEDHIKDSGILVVENCPIGMAITGPKCQAKVGTTLYDVTDLGDYPYQEWVVTGGVEFTEDEDYVAGTPVWVPITGGAIDDIRQRTYITREDETPSNPNSSPLADISLAEIGIRNHADLTNVDPNQHHTRAHRHNNPSDGNALFPSVLFVTTEFRMEGIVEITQLTANANNWGPTEGFGYNIWLISSDAARTVTGIAVTQTAGRYLILINVGAFAITLAHNSGSSAFANRFRVNGAADMVLSANSGVGQLLWTGQSAAEQWRVW